MFLLIKSWLCCHHCDAIHVRPECALFFYFLIFFFTSPTLVVAAGRFLPTCIVLFVPVTGVNPSYLPLH